MLRRFFVFSGTSFSSFLPLLFPHSSSPPLLSSPLLFPPLLSSPLLSVVFRCLCCVCAVVGARAAVVAPGGFCTFLSGCFSFLGNFSSFLAQTVFDFSFNRSRFWNFFCTMGRGVDWARCSAAWGHGRPVMVNGIVFPPCFIEEGSFRPRRRWKGAHHWVHSQMLGVRARARQGRPFRAPPAMTRSRARVFFFRSRWARLETRTKESYK